MSKLTVLLTNNALAHRAGSETYLRDVALALLRRGHQPIAFSLVLGEMAAELRQATVPVIDDLERLGAPPDVIHGHHHLETLIAALALPGVPIVHFCHGWVPWEELPLRHPSVRRYVAVDEVCRDRLVLEEGIPQDRVEILLNFVDERRFRPRPPLPPRPRRALVFSNNATRDGYVYAIRTACQAAAIELDIAGVHAGTATSAPESLLREYDLVFAKGRAALEALVVGCAVVLADRAGCGELVSSTNYERLRRRNFGIRELAHAHEPRWYTDQIAAYDAVDTAAVSARARVDAAFEPAIDRLLDIYARAIAAPPGRDPSAGLAASRHLRRIATDLKRAQAQQDTRREAELLSLHDRVAGLERLLAHAEARALALERDVASYQGLMTLRIRDAVLRVPVVGSALKAGARRFARLSR